MISSIKKLYRQYNIVVKFFAVSLMGGGIDAASGILCLNYFSLDMYRSTTVGFFSGLVAGYLLHQFWTFPSTKNRKVGNFFRFFAAYALLLCIRYCIVSVLLYMHICLNIQNIEYIESVSYIIMLGISFVCNYIICKYFVFRQA